MKKTITLLAAGMILAGTSANAQLVNGNMEQWQNYSSGGTALEAPSSWHGLDSTVCALAPILLQTGKKQVFKSTDKHGGSFAALLISKTYSGLPLPFSGAVPGVLTNANATVDFSSGDLTLSGGTAVTQRVTAVSAWVKYIPKGTDSGLVGVSAVIQGAGAGGADSVIGEGYIDLGSTPNYTQVNIPVTYVNNTQVPTHVQIGFLSSNIGSGVDSSRLYVDDVAMTMASGITQQLFRNNTVTCYPNPAADVLYLSTKEEQTLVWEAMAANGQIIARRAFNKNASVSLKEIASGTYFFRVSGRNNELIQTGKFMVK